MRSGASRLDAMKPHNLFSLHNAKATSIEAALDSRSTLFSALSSPLFSPCFPYIRNPEDTNAVYAPPQR